MILQPLFLCSHIVKLSSIFLCRTLVVFTWYHKLKHILPCFWWNQVFFVSKIDAVPIRSAAILDAISCMQFKIHAVFGVLILLNYRQCIGKGFCFTSCCWLFLSLKEGWRGIGGFWQRILFCWLAPGWDYPLMESLLGWVLDFGLVLWVVTS